jgi:hypothetical protein
MFGSRPQRSVIFACTVLLGLSALAGAAAPVALGAHPVESDYGAVAPTGDGNIALAGRSTSRTSSRSSSLTIARPSGLVSGNVMIAAVTPRLSASEAITAPLGWTAIRRDSNIGGTSLSQALFYKVVEALEPSS